MALRVCIVHGCPTLTASTRCKAHEAAHQHTRGTRQARGYDATHDRNRATLLADNPPCHKCGAPATTAGHIVPRIDGGTSDLANLAPECGPCNYSEGGRLAHRRSGNA